MPEDKKIRKDFGCIKIYYVIVCLYLKQDYLFTTTYNAYRKKKI